MSTMIGWSALALIHFLWQGGVICLGFVVLRRALCEPGHRYVAGLVALLLMLMAPLGTVAWLATTSASSPGGSPPETVRAPATVLSSAPATVPDPASMTVVPDVDAEGSAAETEPFRLLIVGLWLVGVLAFSVFNAVGWLRLHRLRRAASAVNTWAEPMAALCRRIGIRRDVPLLRSPEIDVPMVIGWLKPVVLLPAAVVTGANPTMIEALILHELAHVRRHDYLVNLLQAVVETLLFYHPAVWWISRTVRAEREHLCDDLAAGLCSRRADYMQALADLERRRLTPNLAVAADGGSLMLRIRRLTGNAAPATGSGWTLGAALAALVLGAVAVQFGSSPAVEAQSAQSATGQTRTGETLEGEWRSETDRSNGVQLELRVGSRHRHGSWIERDELERTATGYRLTRDAGTLELTGELDRSWSRFVFWPDPDYVHQMSRIGFDVEDSPRKLFEMASLDVSLDFARGIAAAGYGDIATSRLVEFRIHGVSRQFIEGIAAAGLADLSPSRLVEFRIHGVSPEFVRGMTDSGFPGLTPARLVEFRIHGVSPEFVQGMADSGFSGLTPSRLVEFRIHGVSPEFVARMAASGVEGLSASQLVEFRIHGVTPDFVDGIVRSGLTDVSPSRLVEFRIHGVSPEFVEEMTALVPDLTPSRLVEMRIHGVTAQFAQRAQAEHDEALSASELVSLRIHGRKF